MNISQGVRGVLGMAEFYERSRATVDAAYALGVRRHPSARFEQYLALLREATALTYPRPFPWADAADKRRLFFEATSQCQQLVDASTIWRTLDAHTAVRKVSTILGGTALPPNGTTEDAARNTLLEFATATALQHKGCRVGMTADAEDVVAEYEGLEPFAVECKRPSSRGSIDNNVAKLRRQLFERCKNGGRLGLAVLGVERTEELGGTTPNTPSFDHLGRAVDATLRRYITLFQDAARCLRTPLFPTAPLGGVLLTTSVFLLDRGGMFTVSQMGLFFTGPHDAPLSLRIHEAMSATIQTA